MGKEKKVQNTKAEYQQEIDALTAKHEKIYAQIKAVRKEKYDAKEKYYGKLVEYEI